MEVYTKVPTPFSFGGTHVFIKTEIEEYERIDIGRGYYGILFKNNHTKEWHMTQEDCGALIGSNISKAKLIKRIKDDVGNGDGKLMKQQIEMGKKQMSQAHSFEREAWFKKFRKPKVVKR
jgi:hypothetical protein